MAGAGLYRAAISRPGAIVVMQIDASGARSRLELARHWAADYIGLPYAKTGEGPAAFHCWSFTRHIQAVHYGRELPWFPFIESHRERVRLFRDHPEHRRWRMVRRAGDGDCVYLTRNTDPIHMGVWIDIPGQGGGVLHCIDPEGVTFQKPHALEMNAWAIDRIYRFVGEPDVGAISQ
jgi:hypothetical protein